MAWKVEFQPRASRDLDKLDAKNVSRILSFLHQRLALLENPRVIGEALQGSKYENLWRYRVGDYRILAEIDDDTVRVVVVKIGHRREICRR